MQVRVILSVNCADDNKHCRNEALYKAQDRRAAADAEWCDVTTI